ncbi:MAG TPA: AIR synthase-related protein [bacterium]|nr:AIR synthase-related protein [bacterium]
MVKRIEVRFKPGVTDAIGAAKKRRLEQDLGIHLQAVHAVDVYTIDKDLSEEDIRKCLIELLTDPLNQESAAGRPVGQDFDWAIEIGFLPGVTDNVGNTAREAVKDLLKTGFTGDEGVYYARQYLLKGALTRERVDKIAAWLHNPLIERVQVKSFEQFEDGGGMDPWVPKVKLLASGRVDEVDLEVSDEELIRLGKDGVFDHVDESGHEVRRGPLALDLEFLHVIRDYFRNEGRKPTDVEIEALAQTWSEHCKHTIFAARLDEVDSIFNTYIKAATREVRERMGARDFCVSVFSDNSGVIRFTDDYDVCYKVETHNSPSALDPYGGAITGIVGVNRDPMGTGLGAKLAINMYGFCFGDPYYQGELPFRGKGAKNPVLHPKVIFEGVRVGVEHGGNKSGIPTPWGFIFFDRRYMGKPLVFVGTVGLIPHSLNGRGSHEKNARPGDLIVMAGGRVGKDGIHGATFSSEGLHEGSPASAVQIGDPITQKKMHDAQLELRDQGFYTSVTDNGAGGLSSSVGEMARQSGGLEVELSKVPVKYAGLLPYETWISESQERMTYAVLPENLDQFMAVMKRHDVEATVIGRFTDSSRCRVLFDNRTVMDVDMHFLHDGAPQLKLKSSWSPPELEEPEIEEKEDYTSDLIAMAGRLNLCSREYVVRQYDHEVQGTSVIKPLVGLNLDVHQDAAVVRPLLDSMAGLALSSGIHPWYGDIDPYAMAQAGIDTAIKNVVAVGADPDRVAILDNFCWCSSNEPGRLGQLKRAARACYDAASLFAAPFISGKDSMFNDFKGYDALDNPVKISIPPTLLISSLAIVPDVRRCVTLDPKILGDLVYMIGTTRDELGGSEYYAYLGERDGKERLVGLNVPRLDALQARARYGKIFRAIENGLLASCAPIGPGGLAFTLAKMAMAAECGLSLDLSSLPRECPLPSYKILFSESLSRFVVTVAPTSRDAFEKIMAGEPIDLIGKVTDTGRLMARGPSGDVILDADVGDLKRSYKKTLGW